MSEGPESRHEPEGRDESPLQRSDRQFGELLQELRVVLPGVQVLFAFLLTIPFSARFDQTTDFQRGVFFVTLLSTTVATVLLIAPAALHRMRFRQGVKGDIVEVSHHLALGGLAALGTRDHVRPAPRHRRPLRPLGGGGRGRRGARTDRLALVGASPVARGASAARGLTPAPAA